MKVAREGGLNCTFKNFFIPENLNKFSLVFGLGLQKHFWLETKLLFSQQLS